MNVHLVLPVTIVLRSIEHRFLSSYYSRTVHVGLQNFIQLFLIFIQLEINLRVLLMHFRDMAISRFSDCISLFRFLTPRAFVCRVISNFMEENLILMMNRLSRSNYALLLIIYLFLSNLVEHFKQQLFFIFIALHNRPTNKCAIPSHLLFGRFLYSQMIIDLDYRCLGVFLIIVSVDVFLCLLKFGRLFVSIRNLN